MKYKISLVLAGLMLSSTLGALNQSLLAPAIPTLAGELGGVSLMPWVLSSYFLLSTISMPIYGKLGDLFGRKRLLLLAISIFMLGSAIGGFASDMNIVILARAIQGLGGGGLLTLTQTILADVVPARERGKYMGILASSIAVSSIAGPLLGGWVTGGPGWRWAFWATFPVGALAFTACARFLPSGRRSNEQPLDWGGMLLLALSTSSFVVAVTWGGEKFPWFHPAILALFATTLISAIGFMIVERRVAEPTIPLELFKKRNFNLSTFGALAVAVAMFATMGYTPTYFQMAHGLSATLSGLFMVPMMVAMVITSTTIGSIISRRGKYKQYPVIGTALIAVALVLLSTFRPGQPIWLAVLYLALMGVGFGNSMQTFVLIVQEAFPDRIVGSATATNNYFRLMGATLGTSVVGTVFSSRLSNFVEGRIPNFQAEQIGGLESLTPQLLSVFPSSLRDPIIQAYSEALSPIFLWIAPLLLIASVLLMFLTEPPLATRIKRNS